MTSFFYQRSRKRGQQSKSVAQPLTRENLLAKLYFDSFFQSSCPPPPLRREPVKSWRFSLSRGPRGGALSRAPVKLFLEFSRLSCARKSYKAQRCGTNSLIQKRLRSLVLQGKQVLLRTRTKALLFLPLFFWRRETRERCDIFTCMIASAGGKKIIACKTTSINRVYEVSFPRENKLHKAMLCQYVILLLLRM